MDSYSEVTEIVDGVREESGLGGRLREPAPVERVGHRLLLEAVELEVKLEREVHEAVVLR